MAERRLGTLCHIVFILKTYMLNVAKEALIKAHYNRVCRGNQRQQAKDEAILGGK